MPKIRGKLWCLGPSVSVACTYRSMTNETARGALTRLTGVREPEMVGYCEWLFAMQATSVWVPTQAKRYARALATLWNASDETDATLYELEETHYADEHVKRKARMKAFAEMELEGRLIGGRAQRLGAEGNVKSEPAKKEKAARLTVDLRVPASMEGAWLVGFLKDALASVPDEHGPMRAAFVPDASDAALRTAFDDLRNPRRTYEFKYFSDDSALAMRSGNKIVFMDVDISSCDKSHGPRVFETLYHLFPTKFHAGIEYLVEQLRVRITIRSAHDRTTKVVLKPREPVLYSGSTLTTLVNNVANLMIAWSIARLQPTTPQGVELAARDVGYIVTSKVHTQWESIQFLKHSPVEWNGETAPVMNLGVFLRSLGTSRVYEPLPGERWRDVAKRQVVTLCKSLYPTYVPDAVALLQARYEREVSYAEATPTNLPYIASMKTREGTRVVLPIGVCLQRYGLTQAETLEFVCARGEPGHCYAGHDLERILSADYDLCQNDWLVGPFTAHTAPVDHTEQVTPAQLDTVLRGKPRDCRTGPG